MKLNFGLWQEAQNSSISNILKYEETNGLAFKYEIFQFFINFLGKDFELDEESYEILTGADDSQDNDSMKQLVFDIYKSVRKFFS
jgi:hypothetical protein